MKQVSNADFFKRKSEENEPEKRARKKPVEKRVVSTESIRISKEAIETIKKFSAIFQKYSMQSTAKKIVNTYRQAVQDRFSIAVVGEFSTGKSTFINKLLGKDFLPVSNLPSTALLTRIRYNPTEALVVTDENGKKVKTLPLEKKSWNGLTAHNFEGKDAKGTLYAGIRDEWLRLNNVEIIDTPGAGDLEKERVKVIGDALIGCDGAIITTRATGALSMSEKLFIEQRLITRRTPFLMLVITKLDQIPLKERSRMIDYVIEKLDSWEMHIPVFVPYEVELPDNKHDDIVGFDKIKEKITEWVCNPERAKLTEEWIMSNVLETVESEVALLNEKLLLQKEADDSKRNELINKKKQLLEDAKVEWENLRIKFLERANDCSRLILDKSEEYKLTITERLQYEESHSNDLQRWWSNDYPYRLKIEMSNMSVGVQNSVSRRIADDARWFNNSLERHFKTHVMYNENVNIVDKYMFNEADIGTLEFENINKKRTLARIGTTILSIALYPICLGAGAIPIIATMGVSTGAGIFSEKIFGAKIEKQREIVKDAIAVNVPRLVERSIQESEKRVRAVYMDIIKSAVEKEKEWFEKQREAVEKSDKPLSNANVQKITALKNELKEALNQL